MSEERFAPNLRLHALSWIFALVTLMRQFLLPILAAVVYGARDGLSAWIAAALIPLLAMAVVSQLVYRYGFGPRGLVIREGLLFRTVRQIDYERIENVDTERSLLHRLLGVATVNVQTSTGGKPEAKIQVLSLAAVHELRERVFSRRTDAPEAAPTQSAVLLKLTPVDLVKFGLIDNRGMVLVAAAFGASHEFGFLDFWSSRIGDYWRPDLLDRFTALGWLVQAALAVLVIGAALFAVRLLSIALALVTLHDFTLSRAGPDLRIRHGLLTRLAFTLRLPRIQAAYRTETLLHRWFGRVSLRVDLAGDGYAEADGGEHRHQVRWLAPIATPAHADELTEVALPGMLDTGGRQWQPLAPRARMRIFRRSCALSVLVIFGVAVWLRRAEVLAALLVGVPACWWAATTYVRYTRWLLTPKALLYQYGWLTRRFVIVPRNRIQAVRCAQSPFDRRYAMAAACIDTAGGTANRDTVRIPYLPEAVAADLAACLYRSAAEAADIAPTNA